MEALWYVLTAYPDERTMLERDDVLAFRTKSLPRPFDLAGQGEFSAEIELTSSTSNLFVHLQEVYPDGTVRPVTYGRVIMQAANRGVSITLDDNAYRFQAGHSIQVQIASSDYPHFGVHPGTDENPWFATDRRRTEQTIKLGGLVGARLVLPEIQLPQE